MVILGELIFDFGKITSDSLTIALIGYVIVFLSLSGLYYAFKLMPKALEFVNNLRIMKKTKDEVVPTPSQMVSVDVGAAISAALFLYFNEMHDDEKTVLTIEKISRRYSPWSSKIYNVTRGLNQRF
ncbi:MAG: OadG family protein [Cyclobacteriaceae bacterium]|nr:OadG family protein [Cyclobacteriaceae bacterium]